MSPGMKEVDVIHERLPYDTEPIAEQGIDLVAVFVAILAEWKVALVAFVLAAAVGIAYVYSLKPAYVASATFLPSEGHNEASSVASIFEASGPGALYLGLLRSRTVQDDVVEKAGLFQLWGTHDAEIARAILGGKSFFSQGGDGIITVSVRDENADNAARIANAYLVGLQDLNDKMAQSQANLSRHFFDKQLDREREELQEAQQNLIRLQLRTGQVASGTQASLGVSNIAGYRAQIAGLQVQLAVLRQSEADSNPDIERIQSQIAKLEAQEREQETGTAPTPVGAAIAAARIPGLNLELAEAEAKVASRQAAVTALSGQVGSAQLEATLSHPAFQVIDSAFAPELRVWPPKQQYIDAAVGFAVIFALVIVLVWLTVKRVWANPEHRASLIRLRRAL